MVVSGSSCRGQATVEYLVAAVALGALLFVGKPSLLEQMLSAIQLAYGRMTFALSLP